MKTVGLDCATCTGMALVGDDEDRGKTVQVPNERGYLRLQLIANDVAQTLQVWQPEFVAIEGYAYCREHRRICYIGRSGHHDPETLHQLAFHGWKCRRRC